MSTEPADSANDLADAAFGGDPGRWPLPPAADARELWLRAVAAGGQGRYASAFADLDRLRRVPAGDAVASLALTARASFVRQLGWHDLARSWDGGAEARARSGEARADALIGLAADALGVGRFAASQRALERAAPLVAASGSARLPVRHAWVSAELAMFRGDGAAAVGHARRGVQLAPESGSVRHGVKSQVVLAAALCSAGDLSSARSEGDAALEQTRRFGLVPLQWAIASLLADIGSSTLSPDQLVRLREESAQKVTRWGGVWRPR